MLAFAVTPAFELVVDQAGESARLLEVEADDAAELAPPVAYAKPHAPHRQTMIEPSVIEHLLDRHREPPPLRPPIA